MVDRSDVVVPADAPVTTADELLARADAAARSTPAVDVRRDQFVFTRSRDRGTPGFRDVWLSADGTRGLLRAGDADTSLDSTAPPAGLTELERAIDYPSAQSLRALADSGITPTQLYVKVMLAVHERGDAFDVLRAMLTETVVPPSLRATIYRVAVHLPGVSFTDDTVDGAGRHGVGLVYAGNRVRSRIVIDPVTTAYLGTQDSSVVTSAVVDAVGRYPAGTAPQGAASGSPAPPPTSLRGTDWQNTAIGLPDDDRLGGQAGQGGTPYVVLRGGQATGQDASGRPVHYRVITAPVFGRLTADSEDAVLVLEVRPASGSSSWAVVAYADAQPARLVAWLPEAPESVTVDDHRVRLRVAGLPRTFRWDGSGFVSAD